MTDTWDTIADWYAERVRAGSAMHAFAHDVLLGRLPTDLRGQRILDLGCGEGLITRALAGRGGSIVGIDPSPRMIGHARAAEESCPSGARYAVDDGCSLATVESGSVEWVTAGLALNNVPDLAAAVGAVRRVLVPGGQLVFTVPHPCFEAPYARWSDDGGELPGRVVGSYLAEGFWRSANPDGARRAGNQHRMLSTYVTVLVEHGFAIESVAEPAPDARVVAEQPQRAGLPPFLLISCRRS
ncbi:class I SAM-dependent methyltransferase [Streptomyces sp. GQFP]|uniref:class I SAM-dependent methyltransferase n=1 Tax=Streptomyces sp. GQFP TaxID=2907545 RepID=UPI001F27BFA5|nr:class I SAM-dependent methyltransferase [Streptomyces sp. GQFP]UIX35689.1 class I SAM-dependent methyltransferase [Streptomyces sp. GQFP]